MNNTRYSSSRLFSDAPRGFFLEAGALDGEFISNTLYLERELGWTGLLVEADNTLYSALTGTFNNDTKLLYNNDNKLFI